MRRLFVFDKKDYDPSLPRSCRPSVRAVIFRGGELAMVFSRKFGYYKFPGGGIEEGESHAETLLREVREEAGLVVLPESIAEYGSVLQREKSALFADTIFEQESFYYTCRAEERAQGQKLDAYEADEGFALRFVKPEHARKANLDFCRACADDADMLAKAKAALREAVVLETIENERLWERLE